MGSKGEKVERGGGARESGRASMAKENGDEGDVRGDDQRQWATVARGGT